jgi:hypothetical protein
MSKPTKTKKVLPVVYPAGVIFEPRIFANIWQGTRGFLFSNLTFCLVTFPVANYTNNAA